MVLGVTSPTGDAAEQPTIRKCKACLEGRMHRSPIPKVSATRAVDPLFVVHADICGPIPEPATGTGALYFISFIDDYSSNATVFLLRTKDQALDTFRQYKAWAENYTGFTIKNLHSDGGGEYISSQFNTYLQIMGIHRQITIARTPQQNGVAERFNRTVMESARSMLHAAGLPPKFWGDAVLTAVYLRNRLPTRALNSVTPYEAWRGEKPNLSHLRVWGCLAYVHVPRVKRNKLAATARACVFVGYPPEAKGWKLYDPTRGRYIVTRDVSFQEDISGTKALVGGGVPSSSSSSSSQPPSTESPAQPPVVPIPMSELLSSITSNIHEGVEFHEESDEETDVDSEEVLSESNAAPSRPLISPSSDPKSGNEALSSPPSPSDDPLSGSEASSSCPSSSSSPQSSSEALRSEPAPAVGAVLAPSPPEPSTDISAKATRAKKPKGQRELDRLRDSGPSNPGYIAASPLQPRHSNQGGGRALTVSVSDERGQSTTRRPK